MSKLLTRKKQKWANQFQPKYLRGTALNPNITDALKYQRQLDKLINEMTAEVKKQLKKLFHTDTAKEYFAQDDSIAAQAKILTNYLTIKFNKIFAAVSKPLAETVVNNANKSSSRALHSSLEQLSGGLSLKTSSISGDIIDVINASVAENVTLIKSISEQYLSGVQQAVMRSITTGNGLQDLIPYLEKHEGITKRRAKIIANDQTRKAFANLNKGRMEKLGIKEFEWLHSSGGSEPRQLHIELSGKIFSLDNLPIIDNNTGERGIPGQLINCRCRMLPVITFNDD